MLESMCLNILMTCVNVEEVLPICTVLLFGSVYALGCYMLQLVATETKPISGSRRYVT